MEWLFDPKKSNAAALRKAFMRELRSQADPGSDFDAAELIYGELIGNCVRHAPGLVRIALDWQNEFPILTVHDEGEAFHSDMTLPADPLAESGRGMYIIRALAKAVNLRDVAGDGSKVTAVLPITRHATVH